MTALENPLKWWNAAASLLPKWSWRSSKVAPFFVVSHVSTLAAPLLHASFNACSMAFDQAFMNALLGLGLRISDSVAVSAFFLKHRQR